MKTKTLEPNLCEGSLGKNILLFSIPLMFSNILQVLFNMADIAVVGKFAGPIALGSVGSTSILISLFTGLLIGLSSGVNSLAALYMGAKHKKNLTETVHTALILCLISGILIMVLGIAFSRPILTLLQTKEELLSGALLYLRIYLCGMPALALYNFGNAVLSASGDTRHPLYYLLFSGIINVLLNLFFVIVCDMDVAGVALASMISLYISAILILRLLIRSKEDFAIHKEDIQISRDKMRRILHIGLPSSFQFAIFAIANLFIQTSVNSFDHIMVEGNSAAANADALVYDMMAAFYTACASFIAQNFGAQKRDRILKSFFLCLSYSFAIGLILGISIYIFRYPFLSLFTNDTAVIEAGVLRLSIMSLSYALSSFMDCAIAASRGLGKTIVPTIIVIMGSCVLRIAWVYTIFAHFGTIQSLYLLYPFSWFTTSIAEITYFIVLYRTQVKGKRNT